MSTFDVHDLGEANFFLGMELQRDRSKKELHITQKRYMQEMVNQFGLQDSKTKNVPMSTSIKLLKSEGEPLDKTKFGYSELIGSLLYLTVCTRPDIAFSVGALTRYMANPKKPHWEAAKNVLRYINGTCDLGIKFSSNTDLLGYCDADYAGDLDSRRSTTGYVYMLNGGAISWSSRLQPTVAASTTEAEYMASAHAVKEALWLRKLMTDLHINTGTINIMCDNQGAIKLLKHPIASPRSKHIDVIHHFARERVARGEVKFIYCNTEDMAADILTKAIPELKFEQHRKSMGILA